MMAYHTNIVVDWPARSKEHNIRGHRYVYYVTESLKTDGLKYPKQKRIAIGKPVEGKKRKMYPNDSYFGLFPEERSKLKVPCENCFSDTIKVGAIKTLQIIAENTGMAKILRGLINKACSDFILDFASYAVINETLSVSRYPDFCRNHAVLSKEKTDDKAFHECCLHAIGVAEIQEFFENWIKKCNVKGRVCISYDSSGVAPGINTEKYSDGEDDVTGLAVNICHVFDEKNGTPLFYELYTGPLNDVSECGRMTEKAKKYGLNSAVSVLRDGCFGKETMQSICQICDGYIAMANMGVKSVKCAADEAKNMICSAGNFIREYKVRGIRTEGCLFPGTKNYFYIYSYDGCGSAQEQETKNADFFVIASNLKKEPKEIYEIYRKRDSAGKLFEKAAYPGFDDPKTDGRISPCVKTFVCFVASIFKAYILKHTEGLKRDNGKYRAVSSCMEELEKIEATRLPGKRHTVRYALTECQEDILKALNVPAGRMDDIGVYK